VRDEDCLQLHVRIEPNPVEQVRQQRLVGVAVEAAAEDVKVEVRLERRMEVKHLAAPVVSVLGGGPAVPYSAARPVEELGLADGQRRRPVAVQGGGVEADGECVADAHQIFEVVLQPIVKPLLGIGRHEVADVARAVAFHRALLWRQWQPRGGDRIRHRREGNAIQACIVE
jgi:hypothetical protein